MNQYLITKNITLSFECEAKNEKDALKQFNADFEEIFENTDCKLDDDQDPLLYKSDGQGEYIPVVKNG